MDQQREQERGGVGSAGSAAAEAGLPGATATAATASVSGLSVEDTEGGRPESPPDAMDLINLHPPPAMASAAYSEPSHLSQALRKELMTSAVSTSSSVTSPLTPTMNSASSAPINSFSPSGATSASDRYVVLEKRPSQKPPQYAAQCHTSPPAPFVTSPTPRPSPPPSQKLTPEEIQRRRINLASEFYRKQREEAEKREQRRALEQLEAERQQQVRLV